jgi:hypothetical protein
MNIEFWWRNLRERDHLADKISEWIVKKFGRRELDSSGSG